MVEFVKNDWYRVRIYNNSLVQDYVVAELDSRKLYEITYNKGTKDEKKDLISVTSQELRGVYAISLLSKSSMIICDFVNLYKNGCVKETDFVLPRYDKQRLK